MQKLPYFKRVHQLSPTRFWINNVTPEEAELAIEAGASGCTQNPSYTCKMLLGEASREYTLKLLDNILASEQDDNEAQSKLQLKLVEEIAEKFRPIYENSHGLCGYVAIQGNPFLEDLDSILRFARFHCDAAPNIMAKIPAIPSGFEAIRTLLREDRPILATEVMSVRQAMDCVQIFDEAYAETGKVPMFFFAHIPGIFDEYINQTVLRDKIDIPDDFVWQGGVSVAKRIASMIRSRASRTGFCSGGARGLHHFTEMVGADCNVTINWSGAADELLKLDPPVVQHFLRPVPDGVIDALCGQIPDFRRAYELNALTPEEYETFGPVHLFRSRFEDSWTSAHKIIAERREARG